MTTQHEKILAMHSDGRWKCQAEYHRLFIFSPHKRRQEIEDHKVKCANPKLNYHFKDRPCEHGIVNSRDYLLQTSFIRPPEKKAPTPSQSREESKQSAFI